MNRPNPYSGAAARTPGRAATAQRELPLGAQGPIDLRPMLVRWFEADLAAWERRTGHRVSVSSTGPARAAGSAPVWTVDGRRVSSSAMSDVVYARTTLERALERRAA